MSRYLALAVLLATLVFGISPWLTDGFGGYDPTDFPVPQNDPPIQPAGWAFSIWSLIYLWLIASAAFGLSRRADAAEWQSARPALLVSLLIGAIWLPVAGRAPLAATILLAGMLIFALIAFMRAGSRDQGWLVWPLGVFAGWLTAAFWASTGMVLAGWGLMSEQVAAVICLVAASATAWVVIGWRAGGWSYPAAVLWALAGIFAANLSPVNWLVMLLAAGAGALVVARAVTVREGASEVLRH